MPRASHKDFGRVQAIIYLFSRIVDLDRFSEIILPAVRGEEKRELHHRLGILNMLNPVQVRACERCWNTTQTQYAEPCPGKNMSGSGQFQSVEKVWSTH